MSCSSKHKIAVQGVLGCMILLLGFWHIRYSYANKLNNKACTMADSEKAMRTIEKAIKLSCLLCQYGIALCCYGYGY